MKNKKILKNTIALYIRQLLILFVSLYTVRIVLNVLGVEEYGIYNVVAGLVALCSFLPSALASATQRFFSFALGQSDKTKLNKTFSVNLILYSLIAVMALIILESLGNWFVVHHLNLPLERIAAAQTIYHYAVFTFIFGIFTAPFIAIIIAHEDMNIYAYASISEVLLKLAVTFALVYIPADKLELYGLLLLIVSLINMSVYLIICFRKYPECQVRKIHWDRKLLKEIYGFTGWSLFGQLTTVARNQAVTILLNQYFNPAVVAARVIANTVSSQINMFSNAFNTGLYPPIIKAYAANEKEEMFALIFNGSKLTFFLMWIFSLPIFIEMEAVLTFWLSTPPENAVLFTQLALVEALIISISLPIISAARAPGNMKMYELTLGAIQVGIFIVSWILLVNGCSASSVFITAIAANILMFVVRLFIVSWLVGLSTYSFLRVVVAPVLIVICISVTVSLLIKNNLPSGYVYSFITMFFTVISSSIAMYFFGLNQIWREKLKNIVLSKIKEW
ncbi:oligosaccharide flippase family protein [Aeromonas allosaccharophila]|uniref:lipopolysaccharide biosynthesis protein n=1 Tax=Aeromonas allosaccharophila TaxID=656 RepID=UPI0013C72256|nr:oligosaccharide flippase family protein [Aeromonas allosaccharophila]WDO03521.1 oligosaccharide flippase family protein [Aeromonas allosaccharophila]